MDVSPGFRSAKRIVVPFTAQPSRERRGGALEQRAKRRDAHFESQRKRAVRSTLIGPVLRWCSDAYLGEREHSRQEGQGRVVGASGGSTVG
jgi:hypothetical protein